MLQVRAINSFLFNYNIFVLQNRMITTLALRIEKLSVCFVVFKFIILLGLLGRVLFFDHYFPQIYNLLESIKWGKRWKVSYPMTHQIIVKIQTILEEVFKAAKTKDLLENGFQVFGSSI